LGWKIALCLELREGKHVLHDDHNERKRGQKAGIHLLTYHNLYVSLRNEGNSELWQCLAGYLRKRYASRLEASKSPDLGNSVLGIWVHTISGTSFSCFSAAENHDSLTSNKPNR
jgi:hypothetical protein